MDTDTYTDTDTVPTSDKGDWGKYLTLHRATLKSDWDKAHEIISKDKDALSANIGGGDTVLHVAVGRAVETPKSLLFLTNLLKEISPESLVTLVGHGGFNPLHRAAIVGNIESANMLVDRNPHLLFCLAEASRGLPIHRAVFNSQKPTFMYLLGACKQHVGLSQEDGYENPFQGKVGAKLLTYVIDAGFLDVACELLKDYPYMATTMDGPYSPLTAIAKNPDFYLSGKRYNFYQRFIYSYVPIENGDLRNRKTVYDVENQEAYKAKFLQKCSDIYFYSVRKWIYDKFWKVALDVPAIKHLYKDKVEHDNALRILKFICQEVAKLDKGSVMLKHFPSAIHSAVKNDTCEAVEEIIEHFPRAIWVTDGYFIVQLAIKNRCEKVYNFLVDKLPHDVQYFKVIHDEQNNNLLHLAAQSAPIHKLNQVSGAALQMQKELQWFKVVKEFILPSHIESKNMKQETPMMTFRNEHQSLRKDGEEWMKKTSDACTITAALIITIVFAAAITVPGGDDNGKPIYATKPSFIIFAVSDAISLFSSTTSLLLFLSILTARYRDEDFLHNLPNKLIFGLATLFMSVTSMMVAFSAALYIMFGQGKAWVLIPIATLTCLPIASFVMLQLPLLVDLMSSTYGNGIFAKGANKIIKGQD